jgi:hypothetical protein
MLPWVVAHPRAFPRTILRKEVIQAQVPLWLSCYDLSQRTASIIRFVRAGSPWAVAGPGLPQIRTCAINASGSSGYGFAAARYTEWTTSARGSGNRSMRRLMASQEMRRPRVARDSHFRQARVTPSRNLDNASILPVIP